VCAEAASAAQPGAACVFLEPERSDCESKAGGVWCEELAPAREVSCLDRTGAPAAVNGLYTEAFCKLGAHAGAAQTRRSLGRLRTSWSVAAAADASDPPERPRADTDEDSVPDAGPKPAVQRRCPGTADCGFEWSTVDFVCPSTCGFSSDPRSGHCAVTTDVRPPGRPHRTPRPSGVPLDMRGIQWRLAARGRA
jgi:hypothetical protein